MSTMGSDFLNALADSGRCLYAWGHGDAYRCPPLWDGSAWVEPKWCAAVYEAWADPRWTSVGVGMTPEDALNASLANEAEDNARLAEANRQWSERHTKGDGE